MRVLVTIYMYLFTCKSTVVNDQELASQHMMMMIANDQLARVLNHHVRLIKAM